MKTADILKTEIAALELRISMSSLPALVKDDDWMTDRLAALRACHCFLTTGVVNLRLAVKLAVHGKQNAVADLAGIRRATLSSFLNGKSSMTAENVERVLFFAAKINAGA